jgi:hypothetical protein
MTATEIHGAPRIVSPNPAAAIADVARLIGTLLCLAGVAVLVVVLRFGIYEHFHGEGHVLAWIREILHLG